MASSRRKFLVFSTSALAGFTAAIPLAADAHYPNSVPYRPNGRTDLTNTMGPDCYLSPGSSRASDSRAWMRWGAGVQSGGWVNYNPYIEGNFANVRHVLITDDGKEGAIGNAVWGTSCRLVTGGTTPSVHAWGAAIDTNSIANPYGQTYWDGNVPDSGANWGPQIPDHYQDAKSGNFFWGLNFSGTKDPMHFQFVTGY